MLYYQSEPVDTFARLLSNDTLRELRSSQPDLMNICFICKYPPIEGGVSMHGYWSARGLAQRGHRVFVVTNADEVEATFRMHLSESERRQGEEYAKTFPESSGCVRVYSTQPPDHQSLYFIPYNNPSVTRLATVATNLVRAENCQVIFGYYFEPYGLCAHLVSQWTGVPYVLKHAGSDLHNLADLSELQTAYVEVMRRANRILSFGPSVRKLISFGVPEDRIVSNISFRLPTNCFKPEGPSLDLTSLSRLPGEQSSAPQNALDGSLPVLGIYGKLGEYKGSFDLLEAMAILIRDGFRFYLAAMAHGWAEPQFLRRIHKLGIAEYVRILPFLPHWRVPDFIRSCTAVAFLERDFPIAVHGPTIPAEVIACGKCVIVSEEVARKQPFRGRLRNFKNIVIVPDPKRHQALADCIRFVLQDKQRAAEIGRRGFSQLTFDQDHEKYLDGLERLLFEVAAEKPVELSLKASETNRRDASALLSRLLPSTYALMSEQQKVDLVQAVDLAAFETTDHILNAELRARILLFIETKPESIREVCRYECLVHEWREKTDGNFAEQRSDAVAPFDSADLAQRYPFIKIDVQTVEFGQDVQAIIAALQKGAAIPEQSESIKVMFRPNAAPIKINNCTDDLLKLLSAGSLTTEDLITTLSEHYKCHDEPSVNALRASLISVLEQFYWEGALEFSRSPATSVQFSSSRENSGA